MLEEGTVERPDGRLVAWAAWGEPSGRPLLLCHGTPGSRLNRSADAELYRRVNAHVVTFDRPGYGRSTAQRDRTIVSVADDAIAVADARGWERFAVLGVSGGGPHALALGAGSPDRLSALGVAVGAVPAELIDPDDLIAFNRESRRRAREEGRDSLEAFLAEPASQIAADPMGVLESAMADAPAADKEMMRRPEIREVTAESLREGFVNGPRGWFDDGWVLSNPWGFELGEVGVPVHLWYGALDRNVPLGAVRTMIAELDVASFEIIQDAGHLGWLTREEQVLRTLLDDPLPASGRPPARGSYEGQTARSVRPATGGRAG